MSCPLYLPTDVLMSEVLVHLSIRDLQAVNVAFTSTPTHRARIKELWKSYPYECPDEVDVSLEELKWLKSVDVKPVRLVMKNLVPKNADELVEYVALNCPTLRKFKLDTNNYNHHYCNEASLVKLAQSCPLLEVLHIPCAKVSDDGILALVQNCRQLHTIDIHKNKYITDAGVVAMCSHCPHLKHIGLFDCDSLTDASLIAIANSCPHLESISLYSENFTDNGLIYIADKCHELRSVRVICSNVTSRGLTALWAANPNLMDVNISYNEFKSDDDIIQLARCCPLLQKLNISYNQSITDAAVIAVAEHCLQLKSLNIYECHDLSDASLIALGQHCHELKSVKISWIDNISDVGIAALAAGCPLLQEFNANRTNITDAGAVALARGCRDLRKFVLCGTYCIGIDAISAIAENCPLIFWLELTHCAVNDYTCMYVIAQNFHNLMYLSIRCHDCHYRSTEVVQALWKGRRYLRPIAYTMDDG